MWVFFFGSTTMMAKLVRTPMNEYEYVPETMGNQVANKPLIVHQVAYKLFSPIQSFFVLFFPLLQDTAPLVQLLLMHSANANAQDQVFLKPWGKDWGSPVITW